MSVLIAGHQRSGTTLLKDLFNSHPQAAVTGEFGNYMLLDASSGAYARFILKRWWQKRNAAILEAHPVRGVNMARNLGFVLRYLAALRHQSAERVDADCIEAALRELFSGKTLVGDKYPDHVFRLNKLSRDRRLKCVFIYRDPRDVASSALKRARSELRKTWPDEMRDPVEIAGRWLLSVDLMERNRERIFTIRYEDLVTAPVPVLTCLGNWLGVDGSGFDHTMIRQTSIGKHRQGLTAAEIAGIERVAGGAMRRLGYLV